jgi:hypothetical protein
MNVFARTYWFTWGFLIVAALCTGLNSVSGIFFSGVIASLFSASFTRLYEKLGTRYAPLLGAVLGVIWAIILLLYYRWFGSEEDLVMASWRFGTTLSIHAAGFAGAGLLTALAARYTFGRALGAGFLLSFAMTAIPYGVIEWVDARYAGPIEIIALVSADVPANEFPKRRPGVQLTQLTDDEVKFLKEKWLVTRGVSEFEVIDEQGRRYWPLWRKSFVYPGNPSKQIRRLFIMIPPDLSKSGTWNLPLTSNPGGISLVQLENSSQVTVYCKNPISNIKCELQIKETKNSADSQTGEASGTISIIRISPVGNFYSPDPIKSNLALEFPKLIDESDAKVDTTLKSKKRPALKTKWGSDFKAS